MDNPMPGIGQSGQAALQKFGITNSAQLVGHYLRLNGDDQLMERFLVAECGCHGPSVCRDGVGTLAALRDKCAGFVASEPQNKLQKSKPAAGTTQVMAGFLQRQLSWSDNFD